LEGEGVPKRALGKPKIALKNLRNAFIFLSPHKTKPFLFSVPILLFE
jgi:hypothetical protein